MTLLHFMRSMRNIPLEHSLSPHILYIRTTSVPNCGPSQTSGKRIDINIVHSSASHTCVAKVLAGNCERFFRQMRVQACAHDPFSRPRRHRHCQQSCIHLMSVCACVQCHGMNIHTRLEFTHSHGHGATTSQFANLSRLIETRLHERSRECSSLNDIWGPVIRDRLKFTRTRISGWEAGNGVST